jgi:hypothetical protein
VCRIAEQTVQAQINRHQRIGEEQLLHGQVVRAAAQRGVRPVQMRWYCRGRTTTGCVISAAALDP